MFGRRACELVKEVAYCTPHTMPQYNVSLSDKGRFSKANGPLHSQDRITAQDESVRLVTDEIHEHRAALQDLIRYGCNTPCPAQHTERECPTGTA